MSAPTRYVCTKEAPWDPSKGLPVEHVDAAETGREEDFGGGEYCVRMLCPNCRHEWWKELPR